MAIAVAWLNTVWTGWARREGTGLAVAVTVIIVVIARARQVAGRIAAVRAVLVDVVVTGLGGPGVHRIVKAVAIARDERCVGGLNAGSHNLRISEAIVVRILVEGEGGA